MYAGKPLAMPPRHWMKFEVRYGNQYLFKDGLLIP